MDRLIQAWRDTPRPYKAVAIGIAFVLLMLVSGGTSQIRSYFERRAFERERDTLKAEIQETRAAADASQKRAEDAEADKVKYVVALELAGAAADKAMEKVNAADDEYEKELERIGADASAVERCRRLCAKFNLPPEQCGCTGQGNGN